MFLSPRRPAVLIAWKMMKISLDRKMGLEVRMSDRPLRSRALGLNGVALVASTWRYSVEWYSWKDS